VFFAVETVLQRPSVVRDEAGSVTPGDVFGANSSALTVAMVLLASVVAAVVSQVEPHRQCSLSANPSSGPSA
jgi:hypothetical protein